MRRAWATAQPTDCPHCWPPPSTGIIARMSTMPYQYQIVASPGLSEAERASVSALAALCNAEASLDLKLSLDFPAGGDQDANAFRAYHDGDLVGYCGLDGGGERKIGRASCRERVETSDGGDAE